MGRLTGLVVAVVGLVVAAAVGLVEATAVPAQAAGQSEHFV